MKSTNKLTHYSDDGSVEMVDVTDKAKTTRQAEAHGFVTLSDKVLTRIKEGGLKKGDPFEVARIAGIMAAKKTHDLIPLCHQLQLTRVDLTVDLKNDGAELNSLVICNGRTGVEMEALTAVSVAALTIYDMCKAIDKTMVIRDIYLKRKSGGRSGDYTRSE